MKKGLLLFMLISVLVMLLAACGGKDEEAIVSDLSELADELQSYRAEASLILQTGEEPQEYSVEVWHQKPHYYRIALTSKEREITQIILRNDDGVFVLTPHLNKSFRFQSGWPENQGQVYLYESLIRDILADTERRFQAEGNNYVFEVEANYQNQTLTQQRIHLSQELKPIKVEVMDTDYNVDVLLTFSDFEMNANFEDDAFDMERNMRGGIISSMPAMVQEMEEDDHFGLYLPTYLPDQVHLAEQEEFITDQGHPRMVLRYEGEYNFNVVQERPLAKTVHLTVGKPVDLGFTIGVMSENSLMWTYDGVDFMLSSMDMPEEMMIQTAQSFVYQPNK